ncbi:sporulation histidine kinase inhibitor Sda [Sutcliffiella horikoshii]|uniref:sporulation histidine kinase inhibitor Sda n=1 Tax=Sutcliffiella horikoshii TaxID=79883 RepID=UPI0021CC8995|nr:sporulation histidine kinase inhibitor Sda [Sutcliffiella horikoshii]
MKTLVSHHNCSITKLSDESLKFAYENAKAENLDGDFIQLLEAELLKRKEGCLY